MGKLQAALAWAARGFPVFPLLPNAKEPVHATSWPDISTTDPATITALWTDPVLRTEHDYNIGVNCTDFVVVDVDVKKGKDGHNEYMQLGGTYDTLVVQTPSGGYHCYFDGPDSSNAPLSGGVDIRSHRGYVVAPGSTIDGVPYRVVKDRRPAWVPLAVERLLRDPYARREIGWTESADNPAAIEGAIRFLQSTPPAIEGQRGDETTFTTAARLVREFALSPSTALELMWQHFNPRCVPSWTYDELQIKVENAYQYGTADVGCLDPALIFANIQVPPPPPTIFEAVQAVWGNSYDVTKIAPRPWLIDRMLMLRELTLLIAPGSAGKSSLSLAIAAHLAIGKDFGPWKAHYKCKSIVFNGEDDVAEQSRRLYAVCQMYQLDYEAVKANILLISADELDLKIVSAPQRTAIVNDAIVNQLIEFANNPEIGLVIYDPLIDIHDVSEDDNPAMNVVMRAMKRIAKQANVATLICHHTTKGGNAKQEDRIGNAEIGRGASGIVYKARIAFTLLNASQSDCEEYGLQEHERKYWVRLDDAKMNLTLASDKPVWYKRETVCLPNGDAVGVLKYTEMQKDTTHLRMRIGGVLVDTLIANGQGSMAIAQAVAVLKAQEPIMSNKTDAQIKQRIEGLFSTPVEVKGHVIQARREGTGERQTLIITLT